MGFAASSTASEQTSADDLASLVSAIATTRQAASFSDAQGLQGLQGVLLADSVVSTCRAEDTQLIKVRVAGVRVRVKVHVADVQVHVKVRVTNL